MRPLLPVIAYSVVERLYNRRITLRRDEVEGGCHLKLKTCLTRAAAAEYAEEMGPTLSFGNSAKLVRGRIPVTTLALSNEAMHAVFGLFQHLEHSATRRKKAKNRKQQLIIARLASLEDAVIRVDLQGQEAGTTQAPPRPPRTPRKPNE